MWPAIVLKGGPAALGGAAGYGLGLAIGTGASKCLSVNSLVENGKPTRVGRAISWFYDKLGYDWAREYRQKAGL